MPRVVFVATSGFVVQTNHAVLFCSSSVLVMKGVVLFVCRTSLSIDSMGSIFSARFALISWSLCIFAHPQPRYSFAVAL